MNKALQQYFLDQRLINIYSKSSNRVVKNIINCERESVSGNKSRIALCRKVMYYFSSKTTDPFEIEMFQQLLQFKSKESLTKAANIMAKIQVENENLDVSIQQMEKYLMLFPQKNRNLVEKIKSLQEHIELKQLESKNFEQRAEKELENVKKYAISNIAKQVLEVSDSLQKSIQHSQSIRQIRIDICKQTYSEIKALHQKLQTLFKNFGIESFDPVGKQYDPNTQQSLMKLAVPANLSEQEKMKKSNIVVQSIRTGYMIRGRLLRSAHVIIYQ